MQHKKWTIMIASVLITGSLTTYALLGSYPQLRVHQAEQARQLLKRPEANEIPTARIKVLQEALYKNKQDDQLWYQLGHAYLLNGEYENALTVFDYAIRLANTLSADHYSSKATAIYYLNKQKMSDEIDELLTLALDIDENNQTALMMLANEQFMQARYTQAITLWVKILDTNQAGIDRVGIIQRINQAKQFAK